jgi:hypothetical protein
MACYLSTSGTLPMPWRTGEIRRYFAMSAIHYRTVRRERTRSLLQPIDWSVFDERCS